MRLVTLYERATFRPAEYNKASGGFAEVFVFLHLRGGSGPPSTLIGLKRFAIVERETAVCFSLWICFPNSFSHEIFSHKGKKTFRVV